MTWSDDEPDTPSLWRLLLVAAAVIGLLALMGFLAGVWGR